jgi:hypothetical protein
MNQKQIVQQLKIGRTTAIQILHAHDGELWHSEAGRSNSVCYFPNGCTAVPVSPSTPGTDGSVVPLYPPLKGGTSVQPGR